MSNSDPAEVTEADRKDCKEAWIQMADLVEIAAAQLEAQASRLMRLSRQINKIVAANPSDETATEHRIAAERIDQLARGVDSAIDQFNRVWSSDEPKHPRGH